MVTSPEPESGLSRHRAGVTLILTVAFCFSGPYLLGDQSYLWIKSFHIVAVISWMAGLLYLPRLFVYHCDAIFGSAQSETFKVMEHRLLTIIMTPALIAVWVFGSWLAWRGGFLVDRWFIAKFILVVALSGVHAYFAGAAGQFAADKNSTSAQHWRLMNEVPTVLMIAIVLLVVVKPF